MKKVLTALLGSIFITLCAIGQTTTPIEQKYSPAQLTDDLTFLQQQIFNVHVNPYTELSKPKYEALFASIKLKLTDSLTAIDFLKVIKPVIAYLSDEHAQAYLPDKKLMAKYGDEPIFIPFTLTKKNGAYYVAKLLSAQSNLEVGDKITHISNQPIADVLKQLSLYTSGYADQRVEKALLQFGYLYNWYRKPGSLSLMVRVNNGKNIWLKGATYKMWHDEMDKQTGWNSACAEAISYQKYGDAGYINACTFNIAPKQLDSMFRRVDAVFDQVKRDNTKYLFIDVSKNSGGQSVIGNAIINNFNAKTYRGYQSDWKKSQEYVNLLKSWGIKPDDFYVNAPNGKVFHFDPDTKNPEPNEHRYIGKVFIIVGSGTFSSAMLMATLVKDNKLATIAGQMPVNARPNGFGELYNAKLPNTNIGLLFGVKEWIRPSGDKKDNHLHPDIEVDPNMETQQLIKTVIEKSKSS